MQLLVVIEPLGTLALPGMALLRLQDQVGPLVAVPSVKDGRLADECEIRRCGAEDCVDGGGEADGLRRRLLVDSLDPVAEGALVLEKEFSSA